MSKPKNGIRPFKQWFEQFGDRLLIGFCRAKDRRYPDTFTNYVVSEYEVYRQEQTRDEWQPAYSEFMPGKTEQVFS